MPGHTKDLKSRHGRQPAWAEEHMEQVRSDDDEGGEEWVSDDRDGHHDLPIRPMKALGVLVYQGEDSERGTLDLRG